MLVLRRPDPLPAGLVACIGAFDGLHRGHRALFERARGHGEGVALVTFWPHPAAVLAPDRAPPLLQSPAQRLRVARSLGLEAVAMLPFDHDVADLSPVAFTDRFLVNGLRPHAVVVGEDFRYGSGRAGDTDTLAHDLEPHGIAVHVVGEVTDEDGEKLGSTAIREALDVGDVDVAAQMLGRWHTVEGEVVAGARRGRTLGFPTANVRSDGAMLPGRGVYAVWVSVTDPSSEHFGLVWRGAANVGENPTFADGAATTTGLEVHVIGESLETSLYGRRLEIGFVARLRPERTFDGPDALIAAIEADVARARDLLKPSSRDGMIPPAREDHALL